MVICSPLPFSSQRPPAGPVSSSRYDAPWRAAHSRTTSSTMCPSWSAVAPNGKPVALADVDAVHERVPGQDRVQQESEGPAAPPLRQRPGPRAWCGSGPGRAYAAARGRPSDRPRASPRPPPQVVRPAFLSTCTAVRASMLRPPSRFCRFAAARCWRTISRAKQPSPPSRERGRPSPARPSPGHSVGADHCSGVSRSSSAATWSYSVAARRMARSRSSSTRSWRRLGGLVGGHDASSELSGGRPRLSASMSTARSTRRPQRSPPGSLASCWSISPPISRGAQVDVLVLGHARTGRGRHGTARASARRGRRRPDLARTQGWCAGSSADGAPGRPPRNRRTTSRTPAGTHVRSGHWSIAASNARYCVQASANIAS